jgi:voltage-gated potassium channel
MSKLIGTFTQDMLTANKEFLVSRFHICEIGPFGSLATCEFTTESDIDILVEFRKGYKDFFNYFRLKNYLQELLGKEVDLEMRSAVKSQLKEKTFSQVQYV